jgi:hypothetical protein
MEPVEVTCPKVIEVTLLSTPAYCTVLKTLFAVARRSMLRVLPSDAVLESDILSETVPWPGNRVARGRAARR